MSVKRDMLIGLGFIVWPLRYAWRLVERAFGF